MAKTLKYATLRRKAVRLLKENGWGQESLYNGNNGRLCLVGALNMAATGDAELDATEVDGALLAMGFDADYVATTWNDRKRRRPHEVFARLLKGL